MTTTYDPLAIALRAVVQQMLRGRNDLQKVYEKARADVEAEHEAEAEANNDRLTEAQHAAFNDAKELVHDIVSGAANLDGWPAMRR